MKKDLDTLVADVRTLVELAMSIRGFRIPDDVKAHVGTLSAFIRNGNETEAHALALTIDQTLRSKIGGFLHFSVTDRERDGITRVARFNHELFLRKNEFFDRDLLDRLAVAIGAMVRAVNEEKGNSDFSKRIAVYNETCKTFYEVDEEQVRRCAKDRVKAESTKLARQQREAAIATERNKARDAAAREAQLASRVKLVDELVGLIA